MDLIGGQHNLSWFRFAPASQAQKKDYLKQYFFTLPLFES